MELRRSQSRARISRRTPLSNLTNAQSLSSSSSSAFPPSPMPKIPDPRSSLSSVSNLDAISVNSSAPKIPGGRRISNRDRLVKEIMTNLNGINLCNSKHSAVYERWSTDGRKDKDVASTVAFSQPPKERNTISRGKLKAENRDAAVFGASSVPYKKSKKDKSDAILEESSMTQDYIEKQRAYFVEIDAYNLDEEVVSESELE